MDAAVYCPTWAPFFGFAGVFSAMVFSSLGAAYGTARSGIGIAGIGPFRPELVMKSLIPVVMSGIIAVYGLVVAVLIVGQMSPSSGYSLFTGFLSLAAGLAVGIGGLAAGYAVGVVGDYCVRGYARENRIFVIMVLILIFAEVLGLYGLIVALILNTKADNSICE
ncbi:v-type proton ATPase 16 kDa proteolipid subunit 2 [Umbelopsis sp. WA50703]